MTTPNSSNSKLTKRITPFTSNAFTERLDVDTLIKVLYSDEIIKDTPEWNERKQMEKMLIKCFKKNKDVKPMTKKFLSHVYHNRHMMLRDNININYIYKKSRSLGRVYPVDGVGLCQVRREIRHSLCKDIFVDIDMVNAHPVILNQTFKSQYSMLNDYVNNREKYFKLLCDHYASYGIIYDYTTPQGRELCKEFFIIVLMYFGKYSTWASNNGIPEGIPAPDFYKEFKKQMIEISLILLEQNPELALDIETEKKRTGDYENPRGSITSWFCQEWERRILEVIYDVLKKQKLIKKDNAVLCFDGLMILMSDLFDTEEKQQCIINKCEVEVFNVLKMTIKLKVKGFDEPISYDMLDFEIPDENDVIDNIEEIGEKSQEMLEYYDDLFSLGGINTRRGMAELVNKLYKKHFVFHHKEWYGWNRIENKWEKSVQPLKHCIMYDIQKYLEEKNSLYDGFTNEYNTTTLEKYENYVSKISNVICGLLCNIVEVDLIVKTCEVIMVDNDLQFDLNRNLFGCKNGVYDIEYDVFRPYKFDDLITMSCGFNFEELRKGKRTRELTEDDIRRFEDIDVILNQIFPNKPIKQLVMMIFSTGVSGKCIEKFFMFNGVGGNGKGWLHEFMRYCLGDYFYEADITILTEPKKGGGNANPDLANIDKKRYLLFKEPSKYSGIENNRMKDTTGGGCLKARGLYSSNTDVLLHNTTSMETNTRIKLKEEPTRGDARRMVDVPCDSIFTDIEEDVDEKNNVYLANPMLKEDEWKDEHRVYFLNMLFEVLQILKEEKYNIEKFVPQSIKDRSEAYLLGCFDIQRLFVDLYEKDEKEFISLQDVAKNLKTSSQFKEMTKVKQREMTNDVINEFFKTTPAYKKSFIEKHQYKNEDGKKTVARNILMGWKLKTDDDEEDEDEIDDNETVDYNNMELVEL